MRQNRGTAPAKSGIGKAPAEQVIKDIRPATRKQYSAEEKIRIVLEGLRGEESIAALCRREGIAESLYYNWSKEFLEAGVNRRAKLTLDRRPILGLTQTRCIYGSSRADETRLEQIDLCAAVHLSLDEFELGDLALGLAIRPRRDNGVADCGDILVYAVRE
jgi:transposase-like protein